MGGNSIYKELWNAIVGIGIEKTRALMILSLFVDLNHISHGGGIRPALLSEQLSIVCFICQRKN